MRHRAEVEDLDREQVTGLCALDGDRAAEHVRRGQVDVADVVGRVVVAELGVGPLPALDPELTAGLHEGSTGDVGVPAVVAGDGLVAHGLGLVDAEDHFWHEQHLPCWVRRGDALACLARSLSTTAAGGGERARAPGPRTAIPAARARLASCLLAEKVHIRAGRSSDWSERGVGGLMLGSYQVLTGEPLGARGLATGRSTRRLGGALWSGKARVGGIRWGGRWPPAQGQPVDHLWVVAACLLTGQHPGKGLGCSVGHRHGEDSLGVPTAARARDSRRGRAHRHPLLETATVIAAIVVDGH